MLSSIKKFIKNNIHHLIIGLFVSVYILTRFYEGKINSHAEEGFSLNPPIGQLKLFFTTIHHNYESSIYLAKFVNGIYFDTMNYFQIEIFISQIILFFTLIYIGCMFIYKICTELEFEHYEYKNFLGIIASLFYLYNPFSLTSIWGRGLIPLFYNFALIPVLIYFLSKTLKEKNFKNLLWLFLLIFMLSTSFVMPANIVLCLLTSSLVIFFNANSNLYYKLKTFCIFLIGFFVFNFWWGMPLVYTTIFSAQNNFLSNTLNDRDGNLDSLRIISSHASIEYVFRLVTKYTLITKQEDLTFFYKNYLIEVISYIFPFLVISFIVLKKKIKKNLQLLALFFTGLFFSLGSNEPFGYLFVYIFEKIPVMQVFRAPYEKVGILFMIPYCIFLSYSIVYLIKLNKKYMYFGITIILLYLGLSYPYLFNSMLDYTRFYFPASIHELDKKIVEYTGKDKNNKLVMIPFTGEGISTNWGYNANNVSSYFFTSEIYQLIPDDRNKPLVDIYYGLLEQKDISKHAEKIKIGYIVKRKDILNFNVNFYELEHKKNNNFLTCNNLEYNKSSIVCTLNNPLDFSNTDSLSFSSPNSFFRRVIVEDNNKKKKTLDKYILNKQSYTFIFNNFNKEEDFGRVTKIILESEKNKKLTLSSNTIIISNIEKDKKLGFYEKIWENDIGIIYKILNLPINNKLDTYSITKKDELRNNFYFVPNSPKYIVLDYWFNKNWKIVEYDLNKKSFDLRDYISIFIATFSESKNIKLLENNDEKYLNSWEVKEGKNYVIFYYQELLKILGIYISLFFLILTIFFLLYLKYKKVNAANNTTQIDSDKNLNS